ncbi:MAG: hypothetical protein ACOYVD_02630 [Bacillota bacterium]
MADNTDMDMGNKADVVLTMKRAERETETNPVLVCHGRIRKAVDDT